MVMDYGQVQILRLDIGYEKNERVYKVINLYLKKEGVILINIG